MSTSYYSIQNNVIIIKKKIIINKYLVISYQIKGYIWASKTVMDQHGFGLVGLISHYLDRCFHMSKKWYRGHGQIVLSQMPK